jgi:prepilin-type processing-associated H-X9-DG protein
MDRFGFIGCRRVGRRILGGGADGGTPAAGTHGALTLVELLVVIAIISLLAALLLPVLGRTKLRSGSATCLNNLKQWGVALHLFADERDDRIPPEGWANPPVRPSAAVHTNAWYVVLPRMMNLPWYYDMTWRTNAGAEPDPSLWICPSNPRRSNGNNLFHYCMNGLLDGTGASDRVVRLTSFLNPSVMVFLFDSKNLPAVHAHPGSPGSFAHTNLHGDGAHFLFLDGRAARHPSADYWDFTRNRALTNSPRVRWAP